MKQIVLLILISNFFVGCSMLSPFKTIGSCVDSEGNGIPCTSIESNLEYSINKDVGDEVAQHSEHSDDAVIKDEIVRVLSEMTIDSDITKQPTLIKAQTYRLLIFPYSSGEKYYAARYVYITAGKPKWITGNYIVSDGVSMVIDAPTSSNAVAPKGKGENSENLTDTAAVFSEKESITIYETAKNIQNIQENNNYSTTKTKPVKHKVNAYLLNCRDLPGLDGNSIAVFEQDRVLNIIDKSSDWWLVSFYDMSCYVNSKYLYAEPVESE